MHTLCVCDAQLIEGEGWGGGGGDGGRMLPKDIYGGVAVLSNILLSPFLAWGDHYQDGLYPHPLGRAQLCHRSTGS